MKYIKKMSAIIMVAIVVIMLILPHIDVEAKEYGSEVVYGYDSSTGERNKEYDLKKNSTVKLVQGPYDNEMFGEQRNAVHQNNIWCIERGRYFSYAEYIVSTEYTVTDKVLEYILGAGMESYNNAIGSSHCNDRWQVALWKYIEEAGNKQRDGKTLTTDESRLVNASNNRKMLSDTSEFDIESEMNAGENDIWNKAQQYATTRNNSTVNVSNLEIIGNTATFNLTGYYDSTLKIMMNGIETKNYTISGNKVTLNDISSVSGETLTVKVESTIKSYKAKYRILKCEKNLQPEEKKEGKTQTLLVATSVSDDGSDTISYTSVPVQMNTDISLQKYITKVNGNDLTESETTLTNRKNKKAEATSNEKISKSNTATGNCKNDNIVSIEAGDTVTYRIEVYNNSTVNATSITIRDQIPVGSVIKSIKDATGVEKIKDDPNTKKGYYYVSESVRVYEWNTSLERRKKYIFRR